MEKKRHRWIEGQYGLLKYVEYLLQHDNNNYVGIGVITITSESNVLHHQNYENIWCFFYQN